MKANSTDFTTIAYGLKVTRTDGEVFGFTSAKTSATISGVVYDSAQGLDVSSITTTAGLNVDNLELGTLDDGTLFDRADVYAGVWDNAAFLIFRYNWKAPTDPVENLIAGTFGNVTLLSGKIKAELRGLQQYLQQPAGNATSATCRARFADFPTANGKNLCRLDPPDWTRNFTVASVTDRRTFTSAGYYIPTVDASYSNVAFVLDCEGANASTTIFDGGPNAMTVTAVGNAALTTSTARFGTASIAFDGSGDYCTIPHATTNDLSSGDWTIELSFRLASTAATCVLFNKALGSGVYAHQVWFDHTTGKVGCRGFNAAGDTLVFSMQSTTSISATTWYDVAITRSGTTLTLYLNGASEDTDTVSGSLFASTQTVSLGANNNGSAPMNGQLDNIRVTKSVARTIGALSGGFEVAPTDIPPDDWYGEGIVTWLSGANEGIRAKVKSFESSENTFGLMFDMQRDIEIGDTFSAIAGCRKRLEEDCSTRFDNVLNFQGEPHLPMVDQLTANPNSA